MDDAEWAAFKAEAEAKRREGCTVEHDPLPYYSKVTGNQVAKASVWGSRPSTTLRPRRSYCQNQEHY